MYRDLCCFDKYMIMKKKEGTSCNFLLQSPCPFPLHPHKAENLLSTHTSSSPSPTTAGQLLAGKAEDREKNKKRGLPASKRRLLFYREKLNNIQKVFYTILLLSAIYTTTSKQQQKSPCKSQKTPCICDTIRLIRKVLDIMSKEAKNKILSPRCFQFCSESE